MRTLRDIRPGFTMLDREHSTDRYAKCVGNLFQFVSVNHRPDLNNIGRRELCHVAALDVDESTDRFKVVRVHAIPNAAKVVEFTSIGNRAIDCDPVGDVSECASSRSVRAASIAIGAVAHLPNPTRGCESSIFNDPISTSSSAVMPVDEANVLANDCSLPSVGLGSQRGSSTASTVAKAIGVWRDAISAICRVTVTRCTRLATSILNRDCSSAIDALVDRLGVRHLRSSLQDWGCVTARSVSALPGFSRSRIIALEGAGKA